MNREPADAFTTLTQLLAKSPHYGFGPATAIIAQFHGELEALRENGPPHQIRVGASSNASLPEPAQKLMAQAWRAFDLRQPEFERLRCLKELIRSCNNENNIHLPGARLLRNEAKRWLEYLKHFPTANKSASLRILLSPSLDLPQELNKTWHSETGEVSLDLDLALINDGQFPITHVYIEILLPSNGNFNLAIDGTRDESLSYKGLRGFEVKSIINVGETRLIKLCLKHTEEADVRIRAGYKCFPYPDRSNPESNFVFKLKVPAVIDKDPLRNPYIPDVPLTIERHWQELMKGEHRRIVDDVVKKIQNERVGRLHAIRGLKRTGKTSILYCLHEKIRQMPGYFPVYIDIYSWQLALHEKVDRIDEQNLFYELADSALAEAEYSDSKLAPATKREFDAHLREYPYRMNDTQFKNFVKKLSQALDKHIVFFLDELDSWIKASEFEGGAQFLLEKIRGLIIKLGLCSAVISHEWTGHNWQMMYNRDKLTPILWQRVAFLERADLKELCGLTDLPYTDTAIEFIWRVTGGWPGLVQFVLYRLVDAAGRYSGQKFLADISFVKKVLSDILASVDDRPFLTYFLKSFDDDEKRVLQTLEAAKLIRPDTYQIEGVRRSREDAFVFDGELPVEISSRAFENALSSLFSKQIIESVGEGHHQCKLRVGLLAYPAIHKLYNFEQ